MSTRLPPELFAAFDRGGDPLDDAHVQDWLQQHPEHLAEFAALRAQLRDVATVPTSQSWPTPVAWWRRAPVLLVGLVLAAVAAAVAWRTESAPLPRPSLAPRSAVRSVVVSASTTSAGDSFVETFSQGTLAGREASLRTFAATSAPTVKSRSSLSVEHSIAP